MVVHTLDSMNLRHLTFGCFGVIGLMLLCGLAGLFLDARPDVVGWMGQGMVALAILIFIAFLIFAIILSLRFRHSLHKHPRQQPTHGLFSDLWLRKEK